MCYKCVLLLDYMAQPKYAWMSGMTQVFLHGSGHLPPENSQAGLTPWSQLVA